MSSKLWTQVTWWVARVLQVVTGIVTRGPRVLAELATDESGAETSVATIAWVVLGLIVVAFVVFLVFQFVGSADSATSNVNSSLSNLPQG